VESEVGKKAGAARNSVAGGGVATGDVGIDPNAVYSLGASCGESERLRRQADELAPDDEALLDRVELAPSDSAIDLGCGPRGTIELLHARVSPRGRVVGLDSDSAHVASTASRSWSAAPAAPGCRVTRLTLSTHGRC